ALPISLPGAFRRGDGIPPPDGTIDPPVAGDGAAAARRRPGGRGTARRRRATTTGGRDGRQGGPMTVEETSRQRTGGRAGRQAARARAHIAREPVLAPNYGSPFVRDLDKGRRYGTIEDFRNFVKLAYLSPHLHHSGGTVCEPVDVPVNKRHLDMVYSHIRYSDKPFMGSVTAPDRARDTVEMARLVFGPDYLEDHAVVLSLINANSPLVWDATMLG